MHELIELGLADAAHALRRGEFSAEAYAEALIAQAAKAVHLNAFIDHEPQAIRRAARDADARRSSGAALGRLHGVPLAFKDNIDIAGIATTAGTPALKGNRPQRTAAVAHKLLEEGAIVFGKANMHELAFGITTNNAVFGPARNPYDRDRIAGGSSGGTAVAVAARAVPAGIGTDTGGSVRIPAALCAAVGFRPTVGRWPQSGIVPISHTRDTPGPITRRVGDCVLLDAVVTGSAAAIAAAPLKGIRLGVPRAYFWSPLDAEVARVCEHALARLRDAGAVLVEADLPGVAVLDGAASLPIALYEGIADLKAYLREHDQPDDLAAFVAQIASPDVKGIFSSQLGSGAVSEAVYREALAVHRPALQQAYRRYFAEQRIDAIVVPTTPLPAAPIGADEAVLLDGKPGPTFSTYIRNTDPGSVAGLPGLSLPAGATAAGLPVGIELDAAAGSDARLLAIGLALEELLPRPAAPRI